MADENHYYSVRPRSKDGKTVSPSRLAAEFAVMTQVEREIFLIDFLDDLKRQEPSEFPVFVERSGKVFRSSLFDDEPFDFSTSPKAKLD